MRAVSAVVGLYLALIAMVVVGLAVAGKLWEFSNAFDYAASRTGDALGEASSPPLMTLALSGDTLYLNVTPLRPFTLKYLLLEYPNGTVDVRELDLPVLNSTLLPLVRGYSGEVFRPVLVTGNGVTYAYTPGRDPLLASLDPALAGKAFIDRDVVDSLRGAAPLVRATAGLREVYDPLSNSPLLVLSGSSPLNYTRVKLGTELTLELTIRGQPSRPYACPAVYFDTGGWVVIPCSLQEAGFFDKVFYYKRLDLGGYPVDLYIEVYGLSKGYVYYWYPSLESGTTIPLASFYVALRFKPAGPYALLLNGTASVEVRLPGIVFPPKPTVTVPFYVPGTNVCDAVLDDYLGPSTLVPLILAPYSTFTSNASFIAYVVKTGVIGGFNSTRIYSFTNATVVSALSDGPFYAANAAGVFTTSDYLVVLAAGTYLFPPLTDPVSVASVAVTLALDTLTVAPPPYVAAPVPESFNATLERLVDYNPPPLLQNKIMPLSPISNIL
ncbi:hypothetical protein [Desulfurococcus amylolyticus]|uniref:hypothetical protein n=1 Tax=Desulfurococcus amylolyticus TaxID=94694 RepID=UPI0005B1FFBD|nr:hypothetical protein [Desulfurococcus amylolyticus]